MPHKHRFLGENPEEALRRGKRDEQGRLLGRFRCEGCRKLHRKAIKELPVSEWDRDYREWTIRPPAPKTYVYGKFGEGYT